MNKNTPIQANAARLTELMQNVAPPEKRNHVLQTTLPDGVHWFAGIGFHPATVNKPGVSPLLMNLFSPYIVDAMRMDEQTAYKANELVLTAAAGCCVVPYSAALAHSFKFPYKPEDNKPIPIHELPTVEPEAPPPPSKTIGYGGVQSTDPIV